MTNEQKKDTLSRRHKVQGVKATTTTHPGLWLDRYASYTPPPNSAEQAAPAWKAAFVQHVCRLSTAANADPYKGFFERWKQALADAGAQTHTGTVRTRMVVGLGSESILETSITLHRTYGVPYIPGSALKGLLAAYIRQHGTEQWGRWVPKPQRNSAEPTSTREWQPNDLYTFFFGTTEQAGYLTFYDALYVPGTGYKGNGNPIPLHADVMTVHHSEYYGAKDEQPPADSDSPIPVPFLSATGSYLLAIGMPNVNGDAEELQAWINLAFTLLQKALNEWGIGAKTSSGYGRLNVAVSPNQGEVETALTEDEIQVNNLIQQINNLPNARVATELNQYIKQWRNVQLSAPLRRKIAQALVDKVKNAGREKNSSDKPWYKELIAYLKEVQ